MASSNWYSDAVKTVSGFIRNESEKSIFMDVHQVSGIPIDPDPRGNHHWFPLSQIKRIMRAPPANVESNPDAVQEMDSLVVSEWILGKKGLL